jgi:hypothetical protein
MLTEHGYANGNANVRFTTDTARAAGLASAAKATATVRSARAMHAANARWAKRRNRAPDNTNHPPKSLFEHLDAIESALQAAGHSSVFTDRNIANLRNTLATLDL